MTEQILRELIEEEGLSERAESTLREQLERERERADRLETELQQERSKGCWVRPFGSYSVVQ